MRPLLGLVFALPSVRVKGFYLAITTLGAYFILIWVMQHWSSVTGGIYGLSVPRASIAGVVLDTGTDTDTTDPFNNYDACVYVFTGWYTKADECYGTNHWTAELIAMAQDWCSDIWSEWCDMSLELEDGQSLAYDCRMSIKVATCEEWEIGTWIDSAACQLMITEMGCEFPEE